MTLLFALVISLPVILLRALRVRAARVQPEERRIAMPLLAAIPFLFVIGWRLATSSCCPPPCASSRTSTASEFNVLVQATPYYKFAATILLAMGLVFQVPVAILAATRVGIVTPKQLRQNRRYAVLACAAMAAFLPGDAMTLILETVPLYLLYEVSILVASIVARRDAKRERARRPAAAGPASEVRPVAAPRRHASRQRIAPTAAAAASGPRGRRGSVGAVCDHCDARRPNVASHGVEPDVKRSSTHRPRAVLMPGSSASGTIEPLAPTRPATAVRRISPDALRPQRTRPSPHSPSDLCRPRPAVRRRASSVSASAWEAVAAES